MKRFDYESVKSRLIARAKINADSATILDDSAFNNVLDVFSEGISEAARYLEYNTMEKKWTNAQNMPSLTHMGKLIGRKRKRPVSSIGYVVVSHTDANGNNRLANYGKYFFDLDQASDYDNIIQETNSNYIERSALVPWTCSDVYTIPKGTIFKSANGTQFISTQAVSTRLLSNAYKDISASSSKLEDFISAGGWDGIKYVKVPVIQGIQIETALGTTRGVRFESFALNAENVEDASNTISKNYFSIEVTPATANAKTEVWAEIPNIRLAGPYDKVYETKLSEDGTFIIIKFGDGISGYMPPRGSTIVCKYLETLGSKGNIEATGQIQDMTFPTGYKMIDPRTNTISTFLSCTNITSISGGRDIEDEDEYRLNAPTSYLSSYTTAVKSAYEKKIKEASPVLLGKLKCFSDTNFNASQIDTTFDENVYDELVNEVSIINNTLKVTAIRANGKKFDNATVDEEFIKPIIKTIGDIKGPNDAISYIEPNFIKISPSVKINTYDLNTTEEDIKNEVATSIQTKYSIFNTDFKTPLYASEINHLASIFKYTDSVNMFIEALANVSFDEDKILLLNTGASTNTAGISLKDTSWDNRSTDSIGTLLAIPFNFDKVYSSNKYKQGFKNYKVNSRYLLKVDLHFINNSSKEANSRTFFLYDNRIDTANNTTLEEAKGMTIDNMPVVHKNSLDTDMSSKIGISSLWYPDETKDDFNRRQVRIAQFPYITSITDEEFMSKAKSWTTTPFENRPFEVDENGEKKRYNSSEVASDLRRPLTEGGDTSRICYKKNTNWIPYVDIVYNENYEDSSSVLYANGYFILPLSYLGLNSSINTTTEALCYKTLSSLLKQFIELKVYALPVQDDIEPQNWQDIVFCDDDDIKVERVLKYKE